MFFGDSNFLEFFRLIDILAREPESYVSFSAELIPECFLSRAHIKMDVLIKSGSIHLKISLIVTEIVG